MPPALLIDPSKFDVERVLHGPDEIRKRKPPSASRWSCWTRSSTTTPRRVRSRATSTSTPTDLGARPRPRAPDLPGVLMIEAAAQLCSFYYKDQFPEVTFFGFAGIDEVRFRVTVEPGDRLVLIGRRHQFGQRRASFDTQGLVNGRVAFQARITGMRV